MRTFCLIVTGVFSTLAMLMLFITMGSLNNSAPQQAAGAAMALGLAVIPYVFTRCVLLAAERNDAEQRHKEIIAALRKLADLAYTEPAPQASTGSPVYIG